LTKAHVYILPSKSENFGHAIFEALSAGRPVITSNNTPWKNLKESKAGINVALEDTEIAKAIDFFAELDFDGMEHWSKAAFTYSEEAIDLEKLKSSYRQMFGEQ